jgi:hypothetical protein
MLRLRIHATILTVALSAVAVAACGPALTPPAPDPIADAVAALPFCPESQTVTTFNEGSNPTCKPADHTGDGTGKPSQRLDMIITLVKLHEPEFVPETSRCQGMTPQDGYGGQATAFNVTALTMVCRDVDVYLVLAYLAPNSP